MRRCSVLAVVIASVCSVAPSHGSGPTPATYSWEKDIRPAIEAALCVGGAEVKGAYKFWPEVGGGDDCPGKSADPVLASVTGAITEQNGRLSWLFISMVRRLSPAKPDPSQRPAVEAAFRKQALGDARLMRRYMPAVHAALESAGVSCSDCPGPETVPAPRAVTMDELLPYAVALVWPDRIRGPMSVSLHICSGANGLSEIPNADLDLADAAFVGVLGNQKIMPSIERYLKVPAQYPDAKDDDERLRLIQHDLREGLMRDADFRSAVEGVLVEKAQGLPVVCTDCGKSNAAAPGAAR